MPAPSSRDLRKRVVETYRRGGISYRELARRFAVAEASVSRWLRRFRESGDVQPRAHRGGRKRLIGAKQEKQLEKLVLAHPDWTEDHYRDTLKKRYGIVASSVTVGRAIRRLGYSVKKRPSSLPSATDPMLSEGESSTSVGSDRSPLRVWFLWTKPARTSR